MQNSEIAAPVAGAGDWLEGAILKQENFPIDTTDQPRDSPDRTRNLRKGIKRRHVRDCAGPENAREVVARWVIESRDWVHANILHCFRACHAGRACQRPGIVASVAAHIPFSRRLARRRRTGALDSREPRVELRLTRVSAEDAAGIARKRSPDVDVCAALCMKAVGR